MKRILFTTLLVFVASVALAQQRGAVTATILDADTGEGIAGAVLEVAPVGGTAKKQFFTSADKGVVSIPSLAYGDYMVSVSFIGYNNYQTKLKVASSKTALGTITLNAGIQIQTVVKEVQALRTSQKGDTLNYNAGAFKVANDADVEGLLKKMPGITVSDGTVQAQGEEVKKVFVDGKEFFGDDVTTAIKSLPAQAVDRIEVYNKLSDGAEFSGMDDGEGFKAINIVTHSNMRQGQFGKVYAGIGYDADTKTEEKVKYLVGGNVNMFQGDSRVSVLGLFNNVNQQNFSFEDILGVSGSSGGGRGRGRRGGAGQYMVRPQSGVASVNALGLNYSDTWGKKKKVTFQGSYFFNNTDTKNISTADRWYENPLKIDTMSTRGISDTESYNHRVNARIEWKISDNQNLMIRPGFSYQTNDPTSLTEGWQYGLPNAETPAAGGSGYSYINNGNRTSRNGYNARLTAVYRAKLGKAGRTITLDGTGSLSDNRNNSRSWSNDMATSDIRPPFVTGSTVEPWGWDTTGYNRLQYLRNTAPSSSYRMNGSFTYTEPVSKYAQLSLQYRASYEHQERDKKTYSTDQHFENGVFDQSLSNSYQSNYLTQNVGPGFRYAKERNTFVANVYYQRSSLDGSVLEAGNETTDEIRHTYNNFTYFMMGQLNINRENSIRLFINSYTDNPSVTQLQNVFDLSNARYISSGNPELNPAYYHRVNFHYTNSNIEKGRTFMWMFSGSMATDYVTNAVSYDGTVDIPGVNPNYSYREYSRPVNMDGYWNVMTQVNYGLPVGFLKSNFNVGVGVNYTHMPNMMNDQRNETTNLGYDFRTVLGSNISENVDFTLSWNGTYNIAKDSSDETDGKNRYFNHTASGNMKFVFPLGFTFTGSVAYTQYVGFTNNYDDAYLLCNAWLGKKIFKNQRGEILVGVNDIFNQNRAFARTVGSGWTQNATNSVIGRYYMVQFTYNLRRFGKKGSTNIRDYDGMSQQGQSRARMMGGPGAGGPPPGMMGGGSR